MTELRAAFHRLRRSPGFALGASLSLAIGMSLATAVFSVVNAVLLKPLPFSEGERMMFLYQTLVQTGLESSGSTPRMFVALKQGALPSMTNIAAWTNGGVSIGVREEAQYVYGARVTSGFFSTLRVRPLLGRTFDQNDGRIENGPVVIGYPLWVARFASDSSIIGREILIDRSKRRVIGVMAEGFDFPFGARAWLPLDEDAIAVSAAQQDNDNNSYLNVFGRLKPNATVHQASAEAAALQVRLAKDDAAHTGWSTRVAPLGGMLLRAMREQLQLWTAAAILIALLCAVNFATMSMARGMRRRDEIAVRAALGASRASLAKTLLVEAMLLALLGGVMAVVLGAWILGLASAWFANGGLPVDPSLDWIAISGSVGVTLLVGFIFAGAPALELAKVDLRVALQGAASTMTARSDLLGRRGLVALQLTLALTAVAVVTALIQADRRFQARSIGYDYESLVVGGVYSSDTVRRVDADLVMDALRSRPGIIDAATISSEVPILVWNDATSMGSYLTAIHASPTLFKTLDVSLVAGRIPTEDEVRAKSDVILVSEWMAQRIAGSAPAVVGRRVRVKEFKSPMRWATIIGVVPPMGGPWRWRVDAPVYVLERAPPRRWASVAVRVDGDQKVRAKELTRVITAMDGRIGASNLRPLKNLVDEERGATRGRTLFLSAVAALAMTLAVVGVFGLTSYTTELRLREFGIRVALGANAPRLARAVYGDLWWMSALAVFIGVFASGRLVEFLDTLYRNPMMRGPLIILPVVPTIVSASTLVVISVLGTFVPLRRVLRMDVIRAVQGNG